MHSNKIFKLNVSESELTNIVNTSKYNQIISIVEDKLIVKSGKSNIRFIIDIYDGVLTINRETTLIETILTIFECILMLILLVICKCSYICIFSGFLIVSFIELVSYFIYDKLPYKIIDNFIKEYNIGTKVKY